MLRDVLLSLVEVVTSSKNSFSQTISISNEHGNTFVNVLNGSGQQLRAGEVIGNKVFGERNTKLSAESEATLSKSLKDKRESDLSKTILKLSVDGRKSLSDETEEIKVITN